MCVKLPFFPSAQSFLDHPLQQQSLSNMIKLPSFKHYFQRKSKLKQNEINEISEPDKDSIDDERFDEIIAEIAAEIDHEYKEDQTLSMSHESSVNCINDHDNVSMNKVKQINSINDLYIYMKPLGRGVSSSVVLVKSKANNKQYALKQMLKSKENKESFLREINILRQLKHKNIVQFDSYFVSNSCYYLTTSYCSGGTLLGLYCVSPLFMFFICLTQSNLLSSV